MRKTRFLFLLLLLLTLSFTAAGQQRNKLLTIRVTSVEGDRLEGQPLTLMQTDYEVSYGTLNLDAEGTCSLKVYGGSHRLIIERAGFNTLQYDFVVADEATEATVQVTLTEQTRQPYALTVEVDHDVYSGQNGLRLTWNTEKPVFFDDFESYEPWAITFGEWTGIDADESAAAPLVGNYPNRGVMQYAQIINPLKVEPTWWYDYPILRPYEGQQYVGFTRTNSGEANDDWLISPAITVGNENVLQFMGKAADQFTERFMVYVTTQTDNPRQEDFVRLDKGNFETADYRGWHQYSYDLSAWAGQEIKFAIRYISDYNRYRSFMLMVDNVYVGQAGAAAARRATRRSPANPNEYFTIVLDGNDVGTTTSYSYIINNVSDGHHEVGVRATYIAAESDVTTVAVDVPGADAFGRVTFSVTAQSKLGPDGQQLVLVSHATADSYTLTVSDGQASVASLPFGSYELHVAEGAFESYNQTIEVQGDTAVEIVLKDRILDPWNITVTQGDDGSLSLRWNQELMFSDSFEDYDDFATGSFGEWLTIDRDQQPVYPIALGSATNIVSFPGSGTATNPTAIAPMVFNPWKTSPAMLPTDPAIAAPTGDKSIIFFSPQRTTADKWLISPLLDIHENYVLLVTAKGYSELYPESIEFCISNGSTRPDDFTTVSSVKKLSSTEWTIYSTDLSVYAGEQVRLAVHYTSTDAFLAQIDDFTVGPEDGHGETVDYGNIVRFDIYIDGVKVGESDVPQYVITALDKGSHVIGIQAVYQNGMSAITEYVIEDMTAIRNVETTTEDADGHLTDLLGRRVVMPKHGIYLWNGKKVIR
ncbi:MAG: choice-of-anchor J domain-containing protein [Prevotella sp.]|nr:choice-of-anchor J domain-containing protein [Prevotella sp.]